MREKCTVVNTRSELFTEAQGEQDYLQQTQVFMEFHNYLFKVTSWVAKASTESSDFSSILTTLLFPYKNLITLGEKK